MLMKSSSTRTKRFIVRNKTEGTGSKWFWCSDARRQGPKRGRPNSSEPVVLNRQLPTVCSQIRTRLLGVVLRAPVTLDCDLDDAFNQLRVGAAGFFCGHGKLVFARKPWIRVRFDHINFALRREPHVNASIIAQFYCPVR